MIRTTTLTFPQNRKASVPEMVRAFADTVRSALAASRERARMFAELSQCSDRELADMNLSRADIHDIVRGCRTA